MALKRLQLAVVQMCANSLAPGGPEPGHELSYRFLLCKHAVRMHVCVGVLVTALRAACTSEQAPWMGHSYFQHNRGQSLSATSRNRGSLQISACKESCSGHVNAAMNVNFCQGAGPKHSQVLSVSFAAKQFNHVGMKDCSTLQRVHAAANLAPCRGAQISQTQTPLNLLLPHSNA